MSAGNSSELQAIALTEMPDLLECMRKIGKGMLASGSPVGVVENTLTEIAMAYQVECEIIALPNILMLKIGESVHALSDFSVQRAISLPLNQISAFGELVEQVKAKRIMPVEASQQVDRIFALQPRFSSAAIVLGYVIAIVGLTMRFRVDTIAIWITAAAGFSWHC